MKLGLPFIALLGILMLMPFLVVVFTKLSPYNNLRQIKSQKHQTIIPRNNINRNNQNKTSLGSISEVKTMEVGLNKEENKQPRANSGIQLNKTDAVKDAVGGKIHSVKDDKDFMKIMQERMTNRRKMVKAACQRLAISTETSGDIQIIHAKKYKLVYCSVPKTGCSNMKRVMLALNGYGNSSADIYPKDVVGNTNKLHEEAQKFSINSRGMPDFVNKDNFIKFVVVRHPFERALSAFKNKLTKQWNLEKPQFYKRSQFIRKTYGKGKRRNATDEAPTFEEFVDYLYDANNTNLNGEDNHWNSISVVCYPCQNNFDVIATIDTIEEDLRYLMMLIGAPPNLSMPEGYSKSGRSNTDEETLKKSLSSLPKEKIDNLYKVYKSDFMMFGYDKPDF